MFDPTRPFITRKAYNKACRLAWRAAKKAGCPVRLVHIDDRCYLLWDYEGVEEDVRTHRKPHYRFFILLIVNYAAIPGLPADMTIEHMKFGGFCMKIMVLFPGQWCPVHLHDSKTEVYIVSAGTMWALYKRRQVTRGWGLPDQRGVKQIILPAGGPIPEDIAFPEGKDPRKALDAMRILIPGSEPFIVDRMHWHAFCCPPDAKEPLVITEISTASFEGQGGIPKELLVYQNNTFQDPRFAELRMGNNIKEEEEQKPHTSERDR